MNLLIKLVFVVVMSMVIYMLGSICEWSFETIQSTAFIVSFLIAMEKGT